MPSDEPRPDVPVSPPAAAPVRPRPDASMDLLNQLRREALDPSYAAVVRERGAQRGRAVVLFPAMLVVGLLFGLALANTWRAAPQVERERAEVIARISDSEQRLDELQSRSTDLERELRELSKAAAALPEDQQRLSDTLAASSGADPVTGPGLRITVDDGGDPKLSGSRVVDADLRMAVNGLWASGAEAVAINGHRVSARTAIRNAGDAITVDYRSLSRPYVVEAIGDNRPLEERFRSSQGGRWLEGLAQHYGVQWDLARVGELRLEADPGLTTERAARAR